MLVLTTLCSCKIAISPMLKQLSTSRSSSALLVSPPTKMLTGHCTPWSVSLLNKTNQTVQPDIAVAVNLELTSSGVAVEGAGIYSDANCTSAITQTTIPAGASYASVYIKYNLIKNLKLKATHATLSESSASINTTSEYTRLDLLAGAREGAGNYDDIGEDASLHSPAGLASDGTYIYVSSYYGNNIRMIHILTRAVTTLAGLYNSTGTTDDIGTAARFNVPQGLVALNGYLYVADRDNHTIRRIDLTSKAVVTIAGVAGTAGSANGIGSAASFNKPMGLATDGSSLFISDLGNHIIRKLNPTTFEVTTLAGSAGAAGSTNGIGNLARFNSPGFISTDGTYLYVPDSDSHTIRQVNLGTNEVTTIAGTSGATGSTDGIGTVARFNNPFAAKYDAGFLYIPDQSNHTIRKLDLANGQVTTLSGLAGSSDTYVSGSFANSRFQKPHDVLIENNSLYVSELWNHVIRELNLTNQTTSLFAGYVVNKAWSTIDGVGSDARFNWIDSLTSDEKYIYIPDCSGNVVRRMSIATRVVETIAGTIGTSGSSDGIGTAATMNCPLSIAVGAEDLYVAEYSNIIRKINLTTRQVTTLAGVAGSAGGTDGVGAVARFHYPEGLLLDGDYLYVFEYNGKTVRKIDVTTGAVLTIAGAYGVGGTNDGIGTAARFSGPVGGVLLNGNLYIIDYSAHNIRKLNLTTTEVTTLAGLGGTSGFQDGVGTNARFYNLYGITHDGQFLYVTDYSNNAIRKIDPVSGEVSTLAGKGPVIPADRDSSIADSTLAWPSGITWTPAGLFFSNDGLNIQWVH